MITQVKGQGSDFEISWDIMRYHEISMSPWWRPSLSGGHQAPRWRILRIHLPGDHRFLPWPWWGWLEDAWRRFHNLGSEPSEPRDLLRSDISRHFSEQISRSCAFWLWLARPQLNVDWQTHSLDFVVECGWIVEICWQYVAIIWHTFCIFLHHFALLLYTHCSLLQFLASSWRVERVENELKLSWNWVEMARWVHPRRTSLCQSGSPQSPCSPRTLLVQLPGRWIQWALELWNVTRIQQKWCFWHLFDSFLLFAVCLNSGAGE